jgi:hypothetical protein
MIAQVEPYLDINLQYVVEEDKKNDEYYRERRMKLRPWSFGRSQVVLNDSSLTGIQPKARYIMHRPDSTPWAVALQGLRALITQWILRDVRLLGLSVIRMSIYIHQCERDTFWVVLESRTKDATSAKRSRTGNSSSTLQKTALREAGFTGS